MLLRTQEEKLKFLAKLHNEILRIVKTSSLSTACKQRHAEYQTEIATLLRSQSDFNSIKPVQLTAPKPLKEQGRLANGCPQEILLFTNYEKPRLNYPLDSIGFSREPTGISHTMRYVKADRILQFYPSEPKLAILLASYNETARIFTVDPTKNIDTADLFARIKFQYDKMKKHRPDLPEANEVMQSHRQSKYSVFSPKSQAFAEEYGYFKTERVSPLHQAVTGGDIQTVHRLLAQYKKQKIDIQRLINQADGYGYGPATPLKRAVLANHLDIAQLLIEEGAIITATTLCTAIAERNLALVQFLAEKNPKVVNETLPEPHANLTPLTYTLHLFPALEYDKYPYLINILQELLTQNIQWEAHKDKDGKSISDYAKQLKATQSQALQDDLDFMKDFKQRELDPSKITAMEINVAQNNTSIAILNAYLDAIITREERELTQAATARLR